MSAGQPLDTAPPVPARPERHLVDGVLPVHVVEAGTPAEAARALQWASEHRQSVVIRGGGSKLHWGAAPQSIGLLLDLGRLDRILAHRPGDLTVQVEAGVRLSDLNDSLRAHGQWLPLDPPFPGEATIGGLLATNDSGPRRHRFGTPRDLVIGIELATADGQLAKSGGQVVKNVAGYDLSKMISGSFGALAAIVTATFKLSPVPVASATLVVDRLDAASLARIVEIILASQLEPEAFELHVGGRADRDHARTCLMRFASLPAVVAAEIADATARVAAIHGSYRVLEGADEEHTWRDHTERVWRDAGAVVRVSWLPGNLPAMLSAVDALAADGGIELVGRAGIGAGLLRVDGTEQRVGRVLAQLRSSDVFGSVVLARGPRELRTREMVWGGSAGSPVHAAIKQALDPLGILGAGRGPL